MQNWIELELFFIGIFNATEQFYNELNKITSENSAFSILPYWPHKSYKFFT